MDKKTKIFMIFLIIVILFSIYFTYHRSFISKNYDIDLSGMEDVILE